MLSHGRLSILSKLCLNYSATIAVLSAFKESAAAAAACSASRAAASTAAIESAIRIESAVAFAASAALLPHDANDTATIATAIKTNFSFSLLFKNVIQSIALLKRCKGMYFFNTLFSKHQLFYIFFVTSHFSPSFVCFRTC